MEAKGKKIKPIQKLTFFPFPRFPPRGSPLLASQPYLVSFYFFTPGSSVNPAIARVVLLSRLVLFVRRWYCCHGDVWNNRRWYCVGQFGCRSESHKTKDALQMKASPEISYIPVFFEGSPLVHSISFSSFRITAADASRRSIST